MRATPNYRLFYFTCAKSFSVLLRFFRINDPYRLLGILVVLVLIAVPLFIQPVQLTLEELKMFVLGEVLNDGNRLYSDAMTTTPPLTAWISGWVEMLFGRSLGATRMLGLLLIFFQLAFFTIMLINSRAHTENTYLPGLIFGVLALFSFDMISLSSELLASTMLLFVLNNLFKEIEFRVQRDDIVLNIGVFVGLASLLVFSHVLFLPGALVILAIFTRLSVRKALLAIVGFLLVHGLLMLVYFMKGNFTALYQNFYLANLKAHEESSMPTYSILILGVAPVLFFLFSLFMLGRDARLTKYQSQLSQVMFIWVLVAAIEVMVFSRSLRPAQLIIFVPPLSYFISHYVLLIRRKKMAEFTIWAFIISITTIMYLARYNRIVSVKYDALFPKQTAYDKIAGKRVAIVGTDWGLFQNNKMATGFYDWKLARPVFKELDYFDNVVRIDKAFTNHPPEIVVDEGDLMKEVFERIPKLRTQYTREGNLYFKKE